MKEFVVVSGKGGTGKTTLTASFAVLAGGDAVMADADVDATNLSLVLQPQQLESHSFIASCRAVLDRERCTECGLCRRSELDATRRATRLLLSPARGARFAAGPARKRPLP